VLPVRSLRVGRQNIAPQDGFPPSDIGWPQATVALFYLEMRTWPDDQVIAKTIALADQVGSGEASLARTLRRLSATHCGYRAGGVCKALPLVGRPGPAVQRGRCRAAIWLSG